MNLGPYACRAKQKLINFLRSVAHTFNYECNLKSLKLFSLLFWFFFAFDLFLFCVCFVNAREKLFYLEKKKLAHSLHALIIHLQVFISFYAYVRLTNNYLSYKQEIHNCSHTDSTTLQSILYYKWLVWLVYFILRFISEYIYLIRFESYIRDS